MLLNAPDIHAHVMSLLMPMLDAKGLDLVELTVKLHHRDIRIQILVDFPQGGVNIDQCTQINAHLRAGLEEMGQVNADDIAMEISSPGIDRPLKTFKDFLRNLNYDIRLHLKEPWEGKKEYQGVLMGANENEVTIFTAKKQEMVIPLAIVHQGMIII